MSSEPNTGDERRTDRALQVDAEPDVELRDRPCLPRGDAEVPATVHVSNLAWSTIQDIVANRGPVYGIRDAVEREVENEGYELADVDGVAFAFDDGLPDAVDLEVTLTGAPSPISDDRLGGITDD